jgi:hypothetical protein
MPLREDVAMVGRSPSSTLHPMMNSFLRNLLFSMGARNPELTGYLFLQRFSGQA